MPAGFPSLRAIDNDGDEGKDWEGEAGNSDEALNFLATFT